MKSTVNRRGIVLALVCSLVAAIGEYTASAAATNPPLISAIPVPEPSTVVLAVLGLGISAWWLLRRRETNKNL